MFGTAAGERDFASELKQPHRNEDNTESPVDSTSQSSEWERQQASPAGQLPMSMSYLYAHFNSPFGTLQHSPETDAALAEREGRYHNKGKSRSKGIFLTCLLFYTISHSC